MDSIPLRPLTTIVEYQGRYAAVAFRLLANPVPVYEAFLKTFKKYGMSLRDLKFEGGDLSDMNISCSLFNFSVIVRVRSERLEVTLYRLDTLGEEKANELIADAWNAIKGTDPDLQLWQHFVAIGMHADLPPGLHLKALMQRYVVPPPDLRPHLSSGAIFYLGENPATGEKSGSIILDVSSMKEGALYIRATGMFDAAKVPIELLGPKVDEYLTRNLKSLGLALERAK